MEADEALIDAVREYPCLYNSRISDFEVQMKKENAWSAIAELLERSGEYCDISWSVLLLLANDAIYSNFAVEDCQRRWKTLRERFVKETKRRKTKSGQGTTVCVPWELFGHMEFLREFVKHRK